MPNVTEAAKYILHFEIDYEDEAEMDRWYDEIVHPRLVRLAGYRRSLHCRAGIMEDGSPGESVAKYVSIHEFDSLVGVSKDVLGQETKLGNDVLTRSRVFLTRAFSLLAADPDEMRPAGFKNPKYNPIPQGHQNPPPRMEVLSTME